LPPTIKKAPYSNAVRAQPLPALSLPSKRFRSLERKSRWHGATGCVSMRCCIPQRASCPRTRSNRADKELKWTSDGVVPLRRTDAILPPFSSPSPQETRVDGSRFSDEGQVRPLSARLASAWDRRPVLTGGEVQATPRQLIEIDNGEPRLGGGSRRQGLHPLERCPGAPEPVAPAPAPADARSSFTGDSSSGLLSHPRTARRSITCARERLGPLSEVPDDSRRRLMSITITRSNVAVCFARVESRSLDIRKTAR